jgi:predicted N-acetyltransferase YhbS
MANPKTQETIRPMEPEDISAVLEIDRKITGKKRAVTYQDLITGDLGGELDLSFVGESKGKIRGFILARHAYVGEPVVEVCLIQILGVDPDYQRKGLASRLINAMEERSKALGLKYIRTMVADRDGSLQSFFTCVGFRRGHLVDYTKLLK